MGSASSTETIKSTALPRDRPEPLNHGLSGEVERKVRALIDRDGRPARD